MRLNRPTFRELAIGLGLLRPLHAAEKENAVRKCAAYLQQRIESSTSVRSALEHQLAVAVLERWLTL